MTDPLEYLTATRIVEAMLFASDKPLTRGDLTARLDGVACNIDDIIASLEAHYSDRGVHLRRVGADGFMFQTASDLGYLLQDQVSEEKKLSRAAIETLAVIAYRQPVTRAEIEEIRGVAMSKGTLDVLMEAGWVRVRGRRRTPGRPTTYGTTEDFLMHFSLQGLDELPGLDELKAAGLLDSVADAFDRLPATHKPNHEEERQIDIEEAIAKAHQQSQSASTAGST